MSEPAKPAASALVVPDYLKQMGAGAGTASAAVDSLASAAMSIPRISMRGKKFRFMEGGEEVLSANDSIDIVIIGVEPDAGRFIKTFYANPYGGANQNNPPDCASDDGIRPSGWIQNPQHNNCAECPKNRFGSAVSRSGKAAKACRDSKRLWVVRAEEMQKVVEKPTMYALGVPVTSLKALADFGRGMKGMNVPISAAICKVTMDDDSEFPMISFSCIGFLPEEGAKLAIARGDKAEWKLNYVNTPRIAAPVPNVALPGQPAPQPAAAAPGGNGGTPPVGGDNAAAAGQGAAQTPPPAAGPVKQANMDDIIKNW